MIAWFLKDSFSEDTDPADIWFLIGFELLIEAGIISLAIAFIRMFIL